MNRASVTEKNATRLGVEIDAISRWRFILEIARGVALGVKRSRGVPAIARSRPGDATTRLDGVDYRGIATRGIAPRQVTDGVVDVHVRFGSPALTGRGQRDESHSKSAASKKDT